MFFTKEEIFSLPDTAFSSVRNLRDAIFNRWACTVSLETATRILGDYNKAHNAVQQNHQSRATDRGREEAANV